jgi:hypothetical protein
VHAERNSAELAGLIVRQAQAQAAARGAYESLQRCVRPAMPSVCRLVLVRKC